MAGSSARRLLARTLSAAGIAAAATATLTVAPAASAASDLGPKCSGANIKGMGADLQKFAQQLVWTANFNVSANAAACNGTQGSKMKPTVEYTQVGTTTGGSGACLKDFGAEEGATKFKEFPFCGTDEAPDPEQKKEIEEKGPGAEEKSLETLPVAQESLTVLIHLPAKCLARSEITRGTVKEKLGRLVLDDSVLAELYLGTINTWKQLLEKQGKDGADKLECVNGAAEEETPITRYVRRDHSGVTHIFKAFLAQVNGTKFAAEAYPTGCPGALAEEEKTWLQLSEGCENGRWPTATKVVRPAGNGEYPVIEGVANTASSVALANLGEGGGYPAFSKKGIGGENKKGEQHVTFWAEVQNNAPGEPPTFEDPSSNGDVEHVANANCAKVTYLHIPVGTRAEWNSVVAQLKQPATTYAICGLTYDLALREYAPYLTPEGVAEPEGKAIATTVQNYLAFVENLKTGGGGNLLKNHDYEQLPGSLAKLAEHGVGEIGFKVPG